MDIFELYDEIKAVCASLVGISVSKVPAIDRKLLYIELTCAHINDINKVYNVMNTKGFKLIKIVPRRCGDGIALVFENTSKCIKVAVEGDKHD